MAWWVSHSWRYLGEEYAAAFLAVRRHECDTHHATVPPLDYDWYLRTV